jgi:hypothetical protein
MPDDTHMDLSERAAAPEQMLALRTADGDKAPQPYTPSPLMGRRGTISVPPQSRSVNRWRW